jgi:tetratricopeptide (TPR) repeat protein
VVGTFIVYAPVRHAGLIWDDATFVVNNPLMRSADGLSQFWFSTRPVDYYPVTSTLLWLEWRLWGTSPLGYHLVNVLLHSLNAVVLWRVLRRLDVPGAWLAAALFAVHPVNVESVAWITERKNTLAMFFFLLSVLCYVRFDDLFCSSRLSDETGEAPRRWYWLSLCAFVLALLSKTTVAPLPILLLGLGGWRRGQVTRKELFASLPFFAASAVVGLISLWFEAHRAIGADFVRAQSFWTRLAGAGWAAGFYLYKAALPLDLRPIYPDWHIVELNALSCVPDLLVAAGIFACWHYRKIWGKGPLVGLVSFLVMLLPVLGFLDINFLKYSPVADRWQYFAIIGPLALAASAIATARRLPEVKGLRASSALSAGLLVILGALTFRQSEIYVDPLTFWQTALAGNPDSTVAHNNLGTVLLERGKVDEAAVHFHRALEIEPDHAMAHYNLGGVFRQKGQLDAAMAQFQSAVQLEPSHAMAHYNLGELYVQKGQLDDAIVHFQSALQSKPEAAEIHNALGLALLRKGRVSGALAHLQKAVEMKPRDAEAHNNLARALSQKGELDEAIVHLQIALELSPDQAETHNNLANVLRQKGQLNDAIEQYQRALEMRPNYALAHYNLGEVFQQIGQLNDAIAQYQKALELRPDFAPARRALDKATTAQPVTNNSAP